MIKAILIDVDNTLLDFNKCAVDAIKRGFNDMGLTYSNEVFPVFLEINEKLWKDVEKQIITRDDVHKHRWNMIFKELKIEASGPQFEILFFNYLHTSYIAVDGAKDLLQYLSKKYTVCVASNASYEQQKCRLTKAGMINCLTELFVSEEIGYPKPTKEFFDACIKRLSPVTKDEIIIIGDSLTADIDGGVCCGIKTCWYNHNGEKVPQDLKADYVVNSLPEIKNIL